MIRACANGPGGAYVALFAMSAIKQSRSALLRSKAAVLVRSVRRLTLRLFVLETTNPNMPQGQKPDPAL